MLKLKNLTFSYRHSDSPTLRNVNLEVECGKFVLVEGATGSGKSTLLKAINGLVPHFTGGRLSGSVEINGTDVTARQPYEIAELVAYVNQQPESAFATDTVEAELAFSLEQLGWSQAEMRARINQLAQTFGLEEIMKSSLQEISGGQQQRVAIASALAAGQKLLLLDEPTSALDLESANSLIALLVKLAKSQGITVLIAEHRFERVLPFADLVVTLERDGSLEQSSKRKPSVRPLEFEPRIQIDGTEALEALAVQKRYSSGFSLKPFDLKLLSHQIIGISGDNGSGKSTVLWAVLEEAWRQKAQVAMVPQNSQDLLFLSSVSDELAEADESLGPGATRASSYLAQFVGRIDPHIHPHDLSAGQQLSLVLSIQLSSGAKTLILDEPTRGFDVRAHQALANTLLTLREQGHSILIATHDRDFLDGVADRVLEISRGKVTEVGAR
jgi:energy-coupling factor transporter ATP-binding protein EcfA2